MGGFVFPDYKKSILNLANSIINAVSDESRIGELKSLPSRELKRYGNIIFIVIDGLGYNYLNKHKDLFIAKHLKSKLSSCFLSSTVCANTIFHTGQTPNQTGITGWFTYFRKIGMVVSPYKFSPMIGGDSLEKSNLRLEQFVSITPFYPSSLRECYVVTSKEASERSLNKLLFKGAKVIVEDDTSRAVDKIIDLARKEIPKLVHLYLTNYDKMSHIYGPDSHEAESILRSYDAEIRRLASALDGTNSIIVLTADHGFVRSGENDAIYLRDFPELDDCLIVPFSSEPRAVSCFVKPHKTKKFEKIVKEKLGRYCAAMSKEEVLKKGLFGIGENHKEFANRIGDYMLLMKKNYIFMYYSKSSFKGVHGGLHPDEMYVPLVVLKIGL